MSRKHFTVGEVENLIPALEQRFLSILQLRSGLRAMEQKLTKAGVEISREELERPSGSPAVRHAKAVFRAYYESLGEALEEVRALGGEVKDLELGLVDFLGRRSGEDILICWRLGEKNIGFWHPLDSGYGARRPIDEQIPKDPPRAD